LFFGVSIYTILKKLAVDMENNIRKLRKMHNLTQIELADKTNVTRQTIIAIEKNKYDPSLKLAFKIAKLLKVSMEKIFILDDNENNKW